MKLPHCDLVTRFSKILLATVWKFQDFCITQILHEINFGDSKSAKSVILTHFEALNFNFWRISAFKGCKKLPFLPFGKLQPSKSAKIHENQNAEPVNELKWQILHF